MDILIIGTGRVGSNLAEELLELGENVIVLEQDSLLLENVSHLDCVKVQGIPLENSVLEKAGVQNVDAVLCVSDSETMNVMVGQICLDVYSIPKVIVRIFNPDNEGSYLAMGLETICSTSMTKEKAMHVLGFTEAQDSTTVLGYPIQYTLEEIDEKSAGIHVFEYEHLNRVHILAVVSHEELKLVTRDYLLRTDEELVLVSLPMEE